VTEESKNLSIQNKNLKIRNAILEKGQLSYVHKRYYKPIDKHEASFQEFIIYGIDRSKLA